MDARDRPKADSSRHDSYSALHAAHALVRISPALAVAIAVAAMVDPKPCPACASPDNAGLCHSERCRREVLPQLKEPSLKVDTHSGKYFEPRPAGEQTNRTDHAERMARQNERQLSRLGRSLGGDFTRNRRRARSNP